MKTTKYISAVAALMSLAACQSEEMRPGGFQSDPEAVRIAANVGEMDTRSNPTGSNSTFFNAGDKISLRTEDQSAVVYTLGADGTTWAPEDPAQYLKWNKDTHTFTAYYPETFDDTNLTVEADQRTLENLQKSDLMSFSRECTKGTGGTLTLTMERRTALIAISKTFTWNNQYGADYSAKEVKVHTAGKTITAYAEDASFFYALVPPATADADATFLTITVGTADETTNEELTIKGIPELTAGTKYTYTLTLGKDKAGIGTVTLEDWGTSATPWEGEASNGYIMYKNNVNGMCYDIYTPEGLIEANQLIASGGDYANNVVINLYTDVTLTAPADGGSNWTPIPVREFNGNNHTIKGLVINNPTADYQALISSGGSDCISDLTLEGCKVKGKDRVAGLIADGSGTITNCHVKATAEYPIEHKSTGRNAGGLAAYVINCEIKDCSLTCETGSTVSIEMTDVDGYGMGGLVGYNTGNSTISNCNVTNNGGTITLSCKQNEVGGLVGWNNGSISGCTVDGVTMSGARYVGGFVGVNNSAGKITGTNTVKNCTVTGWKDSTSATVGSDNGSNTSITDDGSNTVKLE